MVSQKYLKKDLTVAVAAGLVISILAWTTLLHAISVAHAVNLTQVSDTLSDSRPGFAANHTIVYTNSTSTTATQTIVYTFDPTGSLFTGVQTVGLADVTSTGMSIVSSCSAGSNRVSMTTSTNALTFTVCAGNTVNAGTITLQVLNNKITNPTSTGSYIIRINGTQLNSADTRVAIVNGVNVTAAVATTFTFTVGGLATSTTLGNGATTTGASATTSLPFGTIAPNTHAELGQQLNVTTNAANGFAVTVHEDQDLTSQTGFKIHLFRDANATSVPSSWAAPANTINNPNTYGHFGITSDDASGTLAFGTSTPLYAGSFQPTSTLTVFAWTGPADGVTQNVGAAKVAFRIEISPLQPAANDYTNNLIYVATPVF
ncbi:MAG TPA: hypothetical protein VMT99_02550 [Candidatus Paceibacterota bacterium]|nr:hypothetical protein [Candidatus Paceibacterota bacterium]